MSPELHPTYLLVIEDDQGCRKFVLDGPIYSIGRDPKCDIRLVSQFASRRHATLVQLLNDDGSHYYRVVDGNLKGKPSANGLLINGCKLRAHDLKNEDEVIFGPKVKATYYRLNADEESSQIGIRPYLPRDTSTLTAEEIDYSDRPIA